MTIREQIKAIQNGVKSEDMTPVQAATYLTELSSLLGNVNDEILRTQMVYNTFLVGLLQAEPKVNKAKLIGESSPVYEELMTAKNAEVLVTEMIRSLKYFIKVKLEEQHEARY